MDIDDKFPVDRVNKLLNEKCWIEKECYNFIKMLEHVEIYLRAFLVKIKLYFYLTFFCKAL